MSAPAPTYGPSTIDDYDALGEDDWVHHELIDGHIIVCASPTNLHNRVVFMLWAALEAVLPAGFVVVGDVDVAMADKRQCPRPDLIVVPREVGEGRVRTQSDDVRLAVEVLSPGTARIDRQNKPRIYAAAGIPSYWLVDLEPFTIVEHRVTGRWYQEVQRVTGDQISVTEPFDLMIDVSEARAATVRAESTRSRNRR
ncbi:Uma2 family endonuclease [Cryptosporangium aurantiacum]|uniref:Endonuclease, Uma2 family (Restriction endonuclease fold) n=1 Tax=Cryptosporangium aurantiacum TaxID=134849 RepID=A0A1M7RH81_9ACTN|nr:Uma2 family endonuclease [Cryptosporangium aurantiacum]SHN45576.1 Endonuclease, Uma2 family (restriction endonuclease fold) [Cryptosporangium aurantiacum]